MKKLVLILSLLLTLPNVGCIYSAFDFSQIVPAHSTDTVVSVNDEIVGKIRGVSGNIPEDDKVKLRKVFLGASSFVQSAVPSTTLVVYQHFTQVESIYDYKKEQYKDFSDTFEAIMKNPAYSGATKNLDGTWTGGVDFESVQKVGDVKQYLVVIFESIAKGLE